MTRREKFINDLHELRKIIDKHTELNKIKDLKKQRKITIGPIILASYNRLNKIFKIYE